MSSTKLKEHLINRIQETDDQHILEEVSRLLKIEAEDLDVYKLSEDQIIAVNEARRQIKKGEYLTNDQADKEIDKWLNK